MAAVFYTFVVLVFRNGLDTLGLLIFLAFPIYVVHEIEEYYLPGGFTDFFNKNIFKVNPSSPIQPLDREVIFWINAIYVYVFLPLGALLYTIHPLYAAWGLSPVRIGIGRWLLELV